MKVIIAGSRKIPQDISIVEEAITKSGFVITQVISGGAKGADRLGEAWAMEHNIPIQKFIPEWGKYGKSAGYRRNVIMAENADALIAIWDCMSKGTAHMINIAKQKNIKSYIHTVYFDEISS